MYEHYVTLEIKCLEYLYLVINRNINSHTQSLDLTINNL